MASQSRAAKCDQTCSNTRRRRVFQPPRGRVLLPRAARARRRVRRARRRCLRGRTTPAARIDLPRRCRIGPEIRHTALRGSTSALSTLSRQRARRSPRTAITTWLSRMVAVSRMGLFARPQSSDGKSICVNPTIFRRLSMSASGGYSCVDFVPGLAINGSDHAFARSHARVVQLDARRFGWRAATGDDALHRECGTPSPQAPQRLSARTARPPARRRPAHRRHRRRCPKPLPAPGMRRRDRPTRRCARPGRRQPRRPAWPHRDPCRAKANAPEACARRSTA